MTTVLVVTSRAPQWAAYSYYQDWLQGFLQHPTVRADVLDIQSRQGLLRAGVLRGRYDAIIFLHNVYPTLERSPRLAVLRGLLSRVRGPRAFFLSNEYRFFTEKAQMGAYLGARVLLTQLNLEDAQMVYDLAPGKSLLSLPYGFTPQTFAPGPPLAQRPVDMGFRGDYYAPYVGHDDRNLLLDDLAARLAARDDVRADIRVGERLYSAGWVAFLQSCRALVGHEAGASRLDATENTRHFINEQQKRLPEDDFGGLMAALRQYGVFDPPPSGRIAAPRNFEALGTQTVQVLLPGRYNDVLQPGVHYLELQRDFSNLDDVLTTLADHAACQRMVENAYMDALAHHTYEKRIDQLLAALV